MEFLLGAVALVAGWIVFRYVDGRREHGHALLVGLSVAAAGVAASFLATVPPGLAGVFHVAVAGIAVTGFLVTGGAGLVLEIVVRWRRRSERTRVRASDRFIGDGHT